MGGDRDGGARAGQPAGQLVGEHQVRQLGLAVRGHPAVGPLRLQVVEVDPGPDAVREAADRHHAGARHRQHLLEQQPGEGEVPQVVGSELQLEPVPGGLPGREHHPGVVDQQVDPRVPGPQFACGGADGIQRGQVEGLDHDVRAGGGAGDAGGGALALLGVPHGQHHRRAARGEDPGGLEPQAGVRAGDHG